jgi:Zn-dependent protease
MDIDLVFIRSGLIVFIVLVVSIVIHEWGHAISAHWLGDDTPEAEGRTTLNPLAHLDMVGTVLIPLVNIFLLRGGFTFIGWGRPVVVNPSNFRNRNRDDILVTFAGPLANIVLATTATVVGTPLCAASPRMGELVYKLIVMNVGLAVFNLIPLPPLDGGAILRRVIGMGEEAYLEIASWGGVILLVLINLPVFGRLISAIIGAACLPLLHLSSSISGAGFVAIFGS